METCIPFISSEINPPVDRKIINILRLCVFLGWSGEDDEYISDWDHEPGFYEWNFHLIHCLKKGAPAKNGHSHEVCFPEVGVKLWWLAPSECCFYSLHYQLSKQRKKAQWCNINPQTGSQCSFLFGAIFHQDHLRNELVLRHQTPFPAYQKHKKRYVVTPSLETPPKRWFPLRRSKTWIWMVLEWLQAREV